MNKTGKQRERIAGVIGGMGPEATVDFMARVMAATDAASDQDHVHLLVDQNPKVPNRHDALAGHSPSVGPELARMAAGLEAAGADFLVMVCNTAHAYSDDIRAAVSIPFVSIVEVVIEALRGHEVTRVGIMAAQGCLRAGLYQRALADSGYEPVLWNDGELQDFMGLVYRIKAGDRAADIGQGLRALAAVLENRGAQVLIAACTEVPLFLSPGDTAVPLLSSTDLLVRRTIDMAQGRLEG